MFATGKAYRHYRVSVRNDSLMGWTQPVFKAS